MEILKTVLGIFTGGAGAQVGGAVATVTKLAAVLAALAPLAMFITKEKDAVFISITYGELAFWSVICGAFVFVIVNLVHRAPPPA